MNDSLEGEPPKPVPTDAYIKGIRSMAEDRGISHEEAVEAAIKESATPENNGWVRAAGEFLRQHPDATSTTDVGESDQDSK